LTLLLVLSVYLGSRPGEHVLEATNSHSEINTAEGIPQERTESPDYPSSTFSDPGGLSRQSSDPGARQTRVNQLLDSGFGDSFAGPCGYGKASLPDHLEKRLGIRNADDRYDLTNAQLDALAELEVLCTQWLETLDKDPALNDKIRKLEEAYKKHIYTPISTEGLSEALRSDSLKALSGGSPAYAALAAITLLMHDKPTQQAVAEYLGTEDLGYISRSSPGVGMLVGCKLGGECGKNGFFTLQHCVFDEAYCNGIVSGLMKTQSSGQYLDLEMMSDYMVRLALDGSKSRSFPGKPD
jgi:hypothetical protein